MKRRMQTRYLFKIITVLMTFLLFAANLASAAPSQDKLHSYLIGLKPGVSAKALDAPGIQAAAHWGDLEAMNILATPAAVQGLAKNPNIAYIEEDRPVYASSVGQSYSDGALTWGLQAVHAEQAWSMNASGNNIRVCILDSGIDYNHPEFIRNGASIIKASANFVNDGHPDATDGNGHGTHVAGTIAGQTSSSGSQIGAAPGVDLYIARVLNDEGSGTTSSVINGLNWCQGNNAKIANLSLGSSTPSRTEQKAFDHTYQKGMLSIAASGNDSKGKIGYPANYNSVVSVGAVDSSLNLAGFSNYGKDQELVAPGVSTLSSVPLGSGLQSITKEVDNGVESSYRSNGLEFSGLGTISGPLVNCGLADSVTSCSGKPNSGAWIALVNRGTNTFSEKVQNVMSQGATAVILTNNDTVSPDDPGNFTLGTAGNWIAAVSISYNSGTLLRSGSLGAGSVEVTPWDYSYFEGTSMATPHVSAVAAIAWSVNPLLTNDQIRKVLQSSAEDLGDAGRDNKYGYGLVQADAAVQMAGGL